MSEDMDQALPEDMPEEEEFTIVEDVTDRIENVMGQFLAAADVQAVYGEPIEAGDRVVIPAAEIVSGAFIGLGSGSANGPDKNTGKVSSGGGSGGAGGGRVFARPVAIIVAGPDGVEVQPVFDYTKIALAALTALGFMFATARRMRRGRIG